MTFPTIPTTGNGRIAGVNQLNLTATLTGPNLTALTGRAAGDLVIAIAGEYQSNAGADAAFTGWAGGGLTWNEIQDSTGTANGRIGVAYARLVTGSETGDVTVTRSGTLVGDASMILMVIPGAHATTAPEASTVVHAVASAADPSSIDPVSWDAEDTLWIGVAGSGETAAGGTWTGITSAPTNYSDYFETAAADTSTIGDFELAVAFRQLNAASEDMAGFTQDITNTRNSALVIAVRPAPQTDFTLTNLGVAQAQDCENVVLIKNSDIAGLNVAQAQAATGPVLIEYPYSDPFTGTDNDPLKSVWAFTHRNGIPGTDVDPTIQSNKARYLRNISGGSIAVSYLRDLPLTDSDESVQFTLNVTPERSYGLIARYNGGSTLGAGGNADLYYLGYNQAFGTGCLFIIRVDDGVESARIVQSTAFDAAGAGDYTLRFQVEGSTLRGKMWSGTGSDPAPGTWNLTTTDATYAGPGMSGIWTYRENNLETLFDNYLVQEIPGGAVNLVGLGVSQGQSSSVVDLVENKTLAGLGVAHAHDTQNVDLVQNSDLAGLGVAHAQATEDPTLTVVSVLAGLDVAHPQSAQNVALTQVHELAGLGAAQAQSAQNVALTQVHELAGLGAAQAQSAQNVDLTQVHALVGLGAAQAQSAQNVALTQVYVLAGLNTLQPQSAPNVDLTIPSPVPRPTTILMTTGRLFGMSSVSRIYPMMPAEELAGTTLTGLGVAQAQASSVLALVQDHVLAGLNVAQAQDMPDPVLVQNSSLAGLGVAQPQSTQNVDLTQLHVLAGLGVAHPQSAPNVVLVLPGSLLNLGVSQAQSSSVIALVQQHVLAGLGAAQAQSAQNIILGFGILGLNVAQAQSIQNTVLVENKILAGLNVTQAHDTQNVDLVENKILAGLNVAQAQAAVLAGMTQLHILASLGVAQAQSVPNILVNSSTNLASLNVAQAQTTTNIALSQLHILAGLDVAQAQATADPTLAVIYDLLGLNVAQAHDTQNVALIQQHNLINLNVAQAQKMRQGVDASLVLTQLHILAGLGIAHPQSAPNVGISSAGTLGINNVAQAQATADPTLERIYNLLGLGVAQAQATADPTLGFGLMGLNVAQPQSASVLLLLQQHFLTGLGVLTPQQVELVTLLVGAMPLVRVGSGTLIRRYGNGQIKVEEGVVLVRYGSGGLLREGSGDVRSR